MNAHATTAGPLATVGEKFVFWGLAALEIGVCAQDDGFLLEYPEDPQTVFEDGRQVKLVFDKRSSDVAASSQQATNTEFAGPGSPFFEWLCEQLSRIQPAIHSAPADGPASVHEIAPALFNAFKLENGRAHLAGCSLEERPFLRLSYLLASGRHDTRPQVTHIYFSSDGSQTPDEFACALGMEDLTPLKRSPSRLTPDVIKRWIESSDKLAAASLPAAEDSAAQAPRRVAATVVWCKYALGKLAFVFDGKSVEHPFEGWAKSLAEGSAQPAPYKCPVTGIASYELAITDDGRITAREALAQCAVSGVRTIAQEMERCEQTGKLALPEFMETCTISGRRMIQGALDTCALCRQRVSAQLIEREQCAACRSLTSVRKEDPRLARVLGQHPALDRWRSWKMAETRAVYVLVASSIWQQLLVVLDSDTAEPVRLALRGRLFSTWADLPAQQWREFLG